MVKHYCILVGFHVARPSRIKSLSGLSVLVVVFRYWDAGQIIYMDISSDSSSWCQSDVR